MQEVMQKKLVTGVQVTKNEQINFCELCVKGKMTKTKFGISKEKRTRQKLQLIHSDVCGPMQTSSYGGKHYFVMFIDDYSKCCAVYFMRN